MLLSFQIPVKHLHELDDMCDYHFALAHVVLQSPTYAEFMRRTNKTVVMDNGVHELGRPMPIEELERAAWLCDADAIIAPDVLYNAEATLAGYDSARRRWGLERTWGVVQGSTAEEAQRCHDALIEKGCHTLCIPYRLARMGVEVKKDPRAARYHYLSYDRLSSLPALGVDESLDTGKPLRLAQYGMPLQDIPPVLPKLDMFGELDVALARANIAALRERLHFACQRAV
jgi:hypothetical protein